MYVMGICGGIRTGHHDGMDCLVMGSWVLEKGS